MEKSSPTAAAAGASDDRDVYIPNLCTPQAMLFAVLLGELVVLLHVLALGSLSDFDWRAFATGSLFVQWIMLCCLALICALRPRLGALSPTTATIVCLSLVTGFTVISSALAIVFAPAIIPFGGGVWDWSLRNGLLALILAAIALRYAYLQQRVANQQRSELQLRLDALRAKIRPHFLFNTLNSIASLIEIQPDKAERAIEDVSELFRAALQDDGRDGDLSSELHLCRLYLDLEQLRLGERLTVDWQIDESLHRWRMPALLLQPLVENAVYHGVAQVPEGGDIRITASRAGELLEIIITNPIPRTAARSSGSGQRMALDNIRQRLDAQYGGAASFTASDDGQRYTAALTIPAESAQ